MTLAGAYLGYDNRRAVTLFEAILAKADVRAAWIGLANAHFGLGDPMRAADALGHALRRHAVDTDVEPLADAVARAAGFAGWCGLDRSGCSVVRAPAGADEAALLGSPVDVAAIARVEGYVEAWHGGLRGWAAHPGNLETKPVLTVVDRAGHMVRRVICDTEGPESGNHDGLLRRHGFRLSARVLDRVIGPVRVIGSDGRDLLGSPLAANPPEPGPAVSGKVVDRTRQRDKVQIVRWDSANAVNDAITAWPDRDVLILHGTMSLPAEAIRRLRKAAYAQSDIGIVTPLLAASAEQAPHLDRLARRASSSDPIDVSYAAEPCLFVKRSCLDEVGGFDADRFAQGYGGQVDFSLRARRAGWRHVAVPNLVVGHDDEFDRRPGSNCLRSRDRRTLARLHPGYADPAQSGSGKDPIAVARRRLDIARWRSLSPGTRGSVVLVTHAHGGGVAQRVQAAADSLRADGFRPIVLRPAVRVDDGEEGAFPDLRFDLPTELPALLRFLRYETPVWVEIHHMLGHNPVLFDAIRRLKVPYDVHVHDYAWVCPRISLVDQQHRYCGEPDLPGCERCIARHGGLTGEAIGVGALRRRSLRFLAGARQVIVPSADSAVRLRRYYPDLKTDIVPHGADADFPAIDSPSAPARVCVLGGIGPHKGYDVLLACARDAAARHLALEFVVVGDTTGDAALLATGHAHITGTYQPEEAVELVRAQNASVGFVPSVWPETWCLTLTELWQAGLPVLAFDLGAQAERIRATGRGWVLPLGLPERAINDALLIAIARRRRRIAISGLPSLGLLP